MGIRAELSHRDLRGNLHEVALFSAGYTGLVQLLTGTTQGISLSYDNLTQAQPYSTPIQKARLQFQFIRDAFIYDEIFTAPEGQFSAVYYVNGSEVWRGVVLPDLCQRTDGDFPNAFTITAKDFTGLEGASFGLQSARRTPISVIADALRATGFDLPIRTVTSWTEANINANTDFLRQVFIDTYALRVYDKDNGDKPLSMADVLSQLCRNFKLFIRQTDGVWFIEQWSHNSVNRLVTNYDANGNFVSDSVQDVSLPANTSSLKVTTGTVIESIPGFKSVTTTFNHRTPFDGIAIPIEFAVNGSTVFSQPYTEDAQSTLSLNGFVTVRTPILSPQPTELPELGLIQIRLGSFYLNGATNSWQMTPVVNPMTPRTGGITDLGTQPEVVYQADFAYSVQNLPPAPTVEQLTVTFFQYGNFATIYSSVNFQLSNLDREKASESITFQLTQTDQFSVNFDDGATLFGDGPTPGSRAAIRYSEFATLDLTSSWSRRGETGISRGLHEQLAGDVMGIHRRGRRMLQARLYGDYTADKVLAYAGRTWQFIGGTFDAYDGEWINATFIENAFDTSALDNFALNTIQSGSTLSTGFFNALQLSRNDVLEAQGILARLELPISGSTTQVFLTQNIDYIAGQFLRVVNPFTAGSVQLRISATGSGAIVPVNLVDLGADIYPVGSYVYFSVESISTGIVVAQNAIRLFNESTQIGQLEAGVSGSVNSVLLRLNTRIRPGQDLEIIGRDGVYRFESAVVAGPGVVMVDIRDLDGVGRVIFADAGSPVLTDPAFVGAYIQIDPADIVLAASNSIVLKINSGGEVVSSLGLFADPDIGGVIAIRADQVLINGVVFTVGTDPITNPGDIASVNYSAGVSGWKIGGDGDAEFNNVTVRGTVTNSTGSYVLDDDGFRLEYGAYLTDNATGIRWMDGTTTEAYVTAFDASGLKAVQMFVNANDGIFLFSAGAGLDPDDRPQIKRQEIQSPVLRSLGDLYVGGRVFLDKQTTIDTATDFPYTVDADDFYIRIEDVGANGGTITLPTATGSGRVLVIKDTTGSAGSAPFTVQRSGSDTIDGATSTSINTNFQTIRLIDAVSGKWELI